MKNYEHDQVIDAIIELFDKRILLGAAWDCMSDAGKASFKHELNEILENDRLSQLPS